MQSNVTNNVTDGGVEDNACNQQETALMNKYTSLEQAKISKFVNHFYRNS
jgi:hypothetical protein